MKVFKNGIRGQYLGEIIFIRRIKGTGSGPQQNYFKEQNKKHENTSKNKTEQKQVDRGRVKGERKE